MALALALAILKSKEGVGDFLSKEGKESIESKAGKNLKIWKRVKNRF